MNRIFPKNIQNTIEWLHSRLQKGASIILFGSQVSGERAGADYDIGIKCEKELTWEEFCLLKNEAEELAWPYKVDLVDLKRAPNEFLEIVEKNAVEI